MGDRTGRTDSASEGVRGSAEIASAARRFRFTRASVDRAECPPGKSQALYWDLDQPGLGLRVTAGGARSFIFEQKLGRQTIRVTIGPASMQIRTAKDKQGRPVALGADTEAARLAALVAQGIDPRAEKAATIARQIEERASAKADKLRRAVSGMEAWATYCEDRSRVWGARHLADHHALVQEGGDPRKRAPKVVKQVGPLRALLDRPLAEIGAAEVEEWVRRETEVRPTRTALAFRALRAFINWCAEHRDYKTIVQDDACAPKRLREAVAKPKARTDALQREQLRPWFDAVRQLPPVVAAYLQALLLTGARREEPLGLRWTEVDFQWKALRIRDKVEGERIIPLTPYVACLLRDLKARNESPPILPRRLRAEPEKAQAVLAAWQPSPWVFSSRGADDGRLQEPRIAHNRALAAAGLPHVTLHGLRRSFGTLAEWVECPVGVVAQIQGHKPSAIAEKHYRVRPLDLLRLWHERIEAWILNEAGIEVPAAEVPAPGLRAVQSTVK